MGYTTRVCLEVYHEDECLTLEKWKDIISKINDSLERKFLSKIFLNDSYDNFNLSWVFSNKDRLMHQISSINPNFIFDLFIGDENEVDYSEEKWIAGKRVSLLQTLSTAVSIADYLETEYPDIYNKYLNKIYIHKKTDYDDENIVFDDVKLDKIQINVN